MSVAETEVSVGTAVCVICYAFQLVRTTSASGAQSTVAGSVIAPGHGRLPQKLHTGGLGGSLGVMLVVLVEKAGGQQNCQDPGRTLSRVHSTPCRCRIMRSEET